MPRFHQTLLIPGNQISEAQRLLDDPTPGNDHVLAGPFTATFHNGITLSVCVINGPPHTISAELIRHDGQRPVVITSAEYDGQVDQEYELEEGDEQFEITIQRAANTILLTDEVSAYNLHVENGGCHCPACRSTDVHATRPTVENNKIWSRLECCSCGARWKNNYQFSGISVDPDDWEPPTSNVVRQT